MLNDLLIEQKAKRDLAKQARTAKSKSAAKPPETKFKRFVQPGVDTKFGRGLIHVPNPVMPYNDISNDHFLNKYPTQQYI